MPETVTITSWADRFETEYPDGLAERLAWLERELGLDRRLMLRLGGLSDMTHAPSWEAADNWRVSVSTSPVGCEQAEEVLTDLVHLFDYDWPAAAAFLHRPPAGSPRPPAGPPVLPPDIPADAGVLVAVAARRPGWTAALAEYLGRPGPPHLELGDRLQWPPFDPDRYRTTAP